MRTAWNIDDDVCRSLATRHLHSIFEFLSSEDKGEGEEFAFHRHSSNIEHMVKESICQIQVYTQPLIKSGRQASTAMRTPALVAMGAMGTLLLTLVSPLATMGKGCIWRVKKRAK